MDQTRVWWVAPREISSPFPSIIFFLFPPFLLSHDLVPLFLFPCQKETTSSIPCSAAMRPQQPHHGGATKQPTPAPHCRSPLPLTLLRHPPLGAFRSARRPSPPWISAGRSCPWARGWTARHLNSGANRLCSGSSDILLACLGLARLPPVRPSTSTTTKMFLEFLNQKE
ncbi:hypothetical protein ACQJBY_052961 [Aegilops geniculata]